ncbi:mediator of DNA damage checkpoint protein 1 [Enoplosus armatus]|uniref:mediator of DNA damage checkpoint protein 1 n=1 Tax=Enoplosus armatus TaxID=215367 RepID=UPI0039962D80
MDATQMISDSILESDEEENEEQDENKRGRPLAKLCILKNEHIPETELPLFLGDNVLGRDPNTCTLPLLAPSISKQHATICISVYRRRGCHNEVDTEALVWDLGSMNGTRKGRLKLTPNVRYALSESDSLVVADIPCQYISCAVDGVSSQGDMRTPVSSNSGVKASLADASGEKGGDTSTGSKKCVNRGTKARVSLPDLKDRRTTPVITSCLSFEQTPTQPQGTLVPESDSDSDGDRRGGGDRWRKALVSDSDSYKSSPTCSTFLSPTNKIVPESEDESPITLSSTKNRPYKHVSFSKEETDRDVGRQQLKEKNALAIVDDSEEEEERAALGGRKSEESGQHVPLKQESNVSLTGEDELPISTPAVLTDEIPAFNMDSDTDMEGEEGGEGEEAEEASAAPVTLNTNQQADQPPNTAQFHMDSDTDVDEDDDALNKVSKSVPSSADHTKPPHVISVIQPEGITMDSDTDVDDDAFVSDGATKAKPMSFQSTHTADSAPLTQLKDFHLDSDTDVDEEEEKDCGANNTCPKIDETPTRLAMKPTGAESTPAAPHSLHPDSDTDDEAIPAPAISEALVVSAVAKSCTTADTGADLGVLSDSDPDVEDDSPLVIPVVVTTLSVAPGATSEAFQSDSDADTDVDESSAPPAGDVANPADLRVDSDTDVEDTEVDFGEGAEGQIPSLRRKNTPGLLAPLLQNCSTPVQLSEGEVEDMDTQAFLSPSSGAVAPPVRSKALSSCSDSEEDEDFVVAETQSFILQTRDCPDNPLGDHTIDPTQAFGLESSGDEKGEQSSRGGSFQLGLSDSSHLQCQAQAVAMESTQAFISVGGGVNVEDTQSYAAISNAERTSSENDEDEETTRCSVKSVKEGSVDLALEATQAYIPESCCDSEDETDEDERKNTAIAETLPTSSILVMAETQPMSAFEEEESLENETEEREEHGEAAHPQERHLSEALSIAETLPMRTSDDEDSIPGLRKRKAKQLWLEEESTKTLTNSELSAVQTQPGEDGESDEEDSIPGPRKRKAKPLQLEEEQTQSLTISEVSAVETQPMGVCEGDQSDEEDSIPGPRKRKAKPLQLEEELTQSLTISEVSAVETQPMVTGEDGESDDEDSIPGPRKRKAKPLEIQEEETQLLTNSEASTVETQPLETKAGLRPQRGKGGQSEAGTSDITVRGKRGPRARLRGEEEQADCSEPPKRQTRGKNKALPTTRGRRGKSRPDESEEEEEVEQAMGARRKKSMRLQKDEEEERLERLRLERERAKQEIIERERKEQEEKERAERTQKQKEEQLARERLEREEKDRIEKERKEQEEKERLETTKRELDERLERETKEREEKERLECEKAEREERERLERIEKERKEQEERLEKAKRELEERLEMEKKEQEHQARLEREAKKMEEREKLEHERAEREEREKIENERKEQEEKKRLEKAKREERLEREKKEQEHQARLEREAKEWEERERLEKEKQEKEANEKQIEEQPENKEEENEPKIPARSRRAARRTIAAPCTTEPEIDSTISTNEDVPARRTRSRSNSSNSVSSERSASSVNTQQSWGKGRGRGTKRTSEPPQGSSLNSDISSCSLSSQSRGRGHRQRGRGRKTEAGPIPPINSQSDQNSAPKPTARGRKSRKVEESFTEGPHEDDVEKSQASTTRGRRRANGSEPVDEVDPSNQEEGCASEESLLPKRNVGGRGQKAVTCETVEAPVAPAVSDGDAAKEKRKGRKRELEANTEEDSSSRSKINKGKEKAQMTEAAEEEAKDEIPVQGKRRGRASSARAKKNAKDPPTEVEVQEESEKMEEETVGRRGRGRPSAVQKKKKEEQEESGTSVDQDAHVEASEPQTPTSSVSRKRQAPVDSSPVAKTPRSCSASPAAGGRLRVASQAYKALFTGVVDEAGERVLARLGGSMAKGVADMNCLVTDKVRRTVKFLCAVAKGVPIVTTHWLEKSGKAGSFLSPNAFVVKDSEQEKKFNFCLQESLRIASSQPLLQGYEIHVTKSVKPEPVQMKDIITCSGATFLPKMPSCHKPQTVVISCEEDWPLCGPALSASLPVVTAEFILTGILQQKLDFQTHSLSGPTSNLQPAGGRGRGRKKT